MPKIKQKKIFYFDSNIYSHINDTGEALKIKKYLKDHNFSLFQSSSNFIEILRIPNESIRNQLSKVFSVLLDRYDYRANSYYEILELVDEMKRCRLSFILDIPSNEKKIIVKDTLNFWKRRWKNIKQNKWSVLQKQFPQIKPTIDKVVGVNKEGQKIIRESLFYKDIEDEKLKVDFTIFNKKGDVDLGKYFSGSNDKIEKLVRTKSWHLFYSVFSGHPACKDYLDWLNPYIDLKKYSVEELAEFWGKKVDLFNIPMLYLSGVVEWFQTSEKISAGNSIDSRHATNLCNCDYFFTEDKRFYKILKKTNSYFSKKGLIIKGVPVLINRASNSVLNQIKSIE